MPTRRDALVTLMAAPAVAAAQQHAHLHMDAAAVPAKAAAPATPQFFSADEFALVTRVADLIIPRSDTPGAADAGAPLIIDGLVRQRKGADARARAALAALNRLAREYEVASFLELSEGQQIEMLTDLSLDLDSEGGRAFQTMKDLTIDAYYSTKAGLVQELGWHGDDYLPEFIGCTHPEHQVRS